MTRSLAIFGDSLMDAGNLDQVANIVGQDPFQESIYNRGGNVKAADGPVFGEHIAQQLGASLGSRQLANLITLPLLRFTGFGSKQLRNYAYAGATSGNAGSSRSGLASSPIGLRAQTRAFAASTSHQQGSRCPADGWQQRHHRFGGESRSFEGVSGYAWPPRRSAV